MSNSDLRIHGRWAVCGRRKYGGKEQENMKEIKKKKGVLSKIRG